jgi:hypothetical protein
MSCTTKKQFLQASLTPEESIELITPSEVPVHMRKYMPGYSRFFDAIPIMSDNDDLIDMKVTLSKTVMEHLAEELIEDEWVAVDPLGHNQFDRTIIAIEEPTMIDGVIKEGSEIIVARWGTGFTSPVHGHATGYLHEALLFGKIKVNTYMVTDAKNRIAVPFKTEIISEPGTFVSMYTKALDEKYPRQILVHNFEALEFSATLHFIPEHTRNGSDNQFRVDYFDDQLSIDILDIKRVDSKSAMYSRVGDVILVRSSNVPEYGDHFIIITGPPVVKPHGLRPQDVAIPAGETASRLLDKYVSYNGLVLLRLESLREAFLKYHGYESLVNRELEEVVY